MHDREHLETICRPQKYDRLRLFTINNFDCSRSIIIGVHDHNNTQQGTEAESLMSEKTEKTAISIKSVLATYLKSLCYFKEGENPFSIRQWLQDDSFSQWLFISSLGDKHESLKPLITAWLDIAVNAILSLSENSKRRIWVILDELSSLQQLPYLTSALAEARKFGASFVIGVQSVAQLAKTYGHEGGREVSSLLNTRFYSAFPIQTSHNGQQKTWAKQQ